MTQDKKQTMKDKIEKWLREAPKGLVFRRGVEVVQNKKELWCLGKLTPVLVDGPYQITIYAESKEYE